MPKSHINLVRVISTGQIDESHLLQGTKESHGGGGFAGKTRAEVVAELSRMIFETHPDALSVSSMLTGSFRFPGYEKLDPEELEAIVTDLRIRVKKLGVVIE